MKKILFPTDFSSPANNAFAYAVKLADDLNARISILHVSNSTLLPIVDEERKEFLEEKTVEVQREINLLMDSLPTNRIDAQKIVYGFFTAAEIAVEAEDYNYDLIIMGMKGENKRLDKWIGSVTTDLMIKAPCPVLAIPEKAIYESIENITLATSLPTAIDLPMTQVSAFAKALSAKLEFVIVENIVRTAEEYQPDQNNMVYFGREYAVVTNPSITDGLNDFVLKNKSNVLSLYMRKRKFWERLFHFSTSIEMAFHTRIPLFIFHK